jgi:adenylate cyclase
MTELLPEKNKITVFLAEDNLFVREGVRSLLSFETDLEVVGTAADYDELIAGVETSGPQVLVTDIRMPPTFQTEGIDAAKHVRKRHPGTGVVILSQYDDPITRSRCSVKELRGMPTC